MPKTLKNTQTLGHAQELVFINSRPNQTEFLYTDRFGTELRPQKNVASLTNTINKIINSRAKVTPEFVELIKNHYPRYYERVNQLPRATDADVARTIPNRLLSQYFPSNITAGHSVPAAPTVKKSEPEPEPVPVVETSELPHVVFSENPEVNKARADLVASKIHTQEQKIVENLQALKAGEQVSPEVSLMTTELNTGDVLSSAPETDPVDLEETKQEPETAGELLKKATRKSKPVSLTSVASTSSSDTNGTGLSSNHERLVKNTLSHLGADTASNVSTLSSGQSSSGSSVYPGSMFDSGSSASGSSVYPGSFFDSATGVSGASATDQSSVVDSQTNAAQPPETKQQSNFAGPGPVRTDKVKYHNTAVKLFFMDDKEPQWDLELERNIRSLSLKKAEINDLLDLLIAKHSGDILVLKRKSNGDIQELVEVVELYFSSKRLMAMGSRQPMAMVPLGTLFKERGILAGGAPPPQDPGAINQPSSGPGDLGPFDVLDQQTQAQQTAPQPVVPESLTGKVVIPEDEATQKLVDAWDNRKVIDGQPIETPVTEQVKEQMLKHAAEAKIQVATPNDVIPGLPGPYQAKNKVHLRFGKKSIWC